MRRRQRALGLIALLGCGGVTPPTSVPRPGAECVLDSGAGPVTLTVGVTAPTNPAAAPVPRTEAERFVFRQLYETLVRVDCTGTVLPALAAAWSSDDDGRVWRFRLREHAVFSDGTPVTAAAVIESWSAPARAPLISPAFASVAANGERELRVELRTPAREPFLFVQPHLAVARPAASGPWQLGSGDFRVDHSDAAVTRVVRVGTATPSVIQFRTVPGADARAALDGRVDVLVTPDRAVAAYARALPGYTVAALPWNRTYALAVRAPREAADTLMGPGADVLHALARVAGVNTRPATPPFWWHSSTCPSTMTGPNALPARAEAGGIVYERGDEIARNIAERLVALAWPVERAPMWLRSVLPADYGRDGPPAATGVADGALLESLRDGRALATVVALPRSPVGCAAVALEDGSTAARLVAGEWRVTPLLDAHAFLVHRANFGRLTVDGDGTIVFARGAP